MVHHPEATVSRAPHRPQTLHRTTTAMIEEAAGSAGNSGMNEASEFMGEVSVLSPPKVLLGKCASPGSWASVARSMASASYGIERVAWSRKAVCVEAETDVAEVGGKGERGTGEVDFGSAVGDEGGPGGIGFLGHMELLLGHWGFLPSGIR